MIPTTPIKALLALTLALPCGAALADGGHLELSIAPTVTWFTSDSLHPVAADNVAIASTARVGYAFTDLLAAYVGYRGTSPLSRFVPSTPSTNYTLEMQGVVAGARATLPLYRRWLRVYGQLDLEISAAVLNVDLGAGRRGHQTTWSVGATPELGIEGVWQVSEAFGLFARLGVGYAFRLDHDFDAVAISSGGDARARPVDFGAANLSGLTAGWTFGMNF